MAEHVDKKEDDFTRETSREDFGTEIDSFDAHEYLAKVHHEATPFQRYISLNPILALGLTLQVSWEAVSVLFQTAFVNGGPASLVYGMIIAVTGSSATAATLGEMASVDPTVGAQYRWAARYAPKNLKPHFWGFIQGWLTWIAWIATCSATPFTCATLLQSILIFNCYPESYDPKRWHVTLMSWACIAIAVVGNLWARKALVIFETLAGLFHSALFLAVVITLGVLVKRNPSSFVWDTLLSNQPFNFAGTAFGWSSPGVAFCVGLVTPVGTVVGFDGVIHMSGETKDAARNVPRAMLYSVLINGVMAFSFVICLLYTLGDPAVTLYPEYVLTLQNPPFPIVSVLYNATKSRAATNALCGLLLCIVIVAGFSIFASVSRLTWSFAKDGGLPFSKVFSKFNHRLQIPVNALLLTGVCCGILPLSNIGSTVAFYAIVSLAILSLYISYTAPICFLIARKIQGDRPKGPWQLGRWGILVNVFALCYCIFVTVWLPFPQALPITSSTMNYAAPVWGGCAILAVIDYLLRGRKHFRLKE